MSNKYRNEDPTPNTCSKIDEVIGILISANIDEDPWYNEKEAIGLMEEIRTANEKLREWGRDLCQIRDDLQDEINSLKRENENLRQEVIEMESQILDND